MTPFTSLRAQAAPLRENGRLMSDVDTDRIIPKQFLKTLTRDGLAEGLFFELKTRSDGTPDPDFVLNTPEGRAAEMLIAGPNFGCGSSREHAPWALLDQGIRAVIAPSFADIFRNNCLKNGILPVELPLEACEALAEEAGGENAVFTADLPSQTVSAPSGKQFAFDIAPGAKAALLEGADEIARTLEQEDAIAAYEARAARNTPWIHARGGAG